MTKRRAARPDGAAAQPDEPTLRLRDPIDVLAAIPYVIGYQPTNSVIVIGMRGKRLVFTARVDLLAAGAPPRDVREQVDHLVSIVLRQDATGVLLVGFGPADRVGPIVAGLREAYRRAGLAVLEALRAADGRYWSYLCSDPVCCPSEGSPYDVNASPVPAQWTVAGRVALPDRETYENQIKPIGGVSRISVRQATRRADERLFELIARPPDEQTVEKALMAAGTCAIDEAIERQRDGRRLDDEEVAWLTVVLASIPVRDVAWAHISGPVEALERHRALWLDVMRRAEPDLIAAPASLFAFAAWRCGEGSLARLALERVLDEEPDYNMAVLLHNALIHGLPPSALNGFPGRTVRRPPAQRRRKRSSSRRAGSRRG